jgi:hypothetical protein
VPRNVAKLADEPRGRISSIQLFDLIRIGLVKIDSSEILEVRDLDVEVQHIELEVAWGVLWEVEVAEDE